MFKVLFGLVALAGLFLVTPAGDRLKSAAIEVVNPMAAERRTLGTLQEQLDTVSQTVNSKGFASASTPEKIRQLNNLLDGAQGSLAQAREKAQDGDLAATVSSLVRKAAALPNGPQPTIAVCPN